jgi:hypothetical protein
MERLGKVAGRHASVTHPPLILKKNRSLQSHSTNHIWPNPDQTTKSRVFGEKPLKFGQILYLVNCSHQIDLSG